MRTRLLASTVGIAVVVALLLGLPMAGLLDRLAYDTARSQLERQAVSVGLALEPGLVSGQVPRPELLAAIAGDQQRIVLVTGAGTRVSGGSVDGDTISATAPGPVDSRLALFASDDEVRDQIRRSWAALAALALLGVGAAVVLAAVQTRRLVTPLRRLRRQADRIGSGDFTAPAPRSGLVEFDAIAEALDDAAGRISALVAAERSFSANASHQLRTALTGLALRLDLLAEHDDPLVREEATAAQQQAERLQRTVEDLLLLARTGRAGERRPVDLHALAAEHVADWADRFRAERRTVSVHGSAPVIGQVSPGGVGEALDVLLDNALIHGDGAVAVTVAAPGSEVTIDVQDEGPGFDDGADVFRPRTQDGHGFGLRLARTLAEADGGTLQLMVRRPPRLRLTLPAATNRAGPSGQGGEAIESRT